MNLLSISRKLYRFPNTTSARRTKWPEGKAIIYSQRLKSFLVKEGGAAYLFNADDVLGNDWEIL
jgi:hypothetical protein